MPASSKFGRQPFMDELRRNDHTVRSAAALMGVPYLHVRNAGYGYVAAKHELRDALVRLLGVPIEDLLTEEARLTVPHYGDKGRRLIDEAQRVLAEAS